MSVVVTGRAPLPPLTGVDDPHRRWNADTTRSRSGTPRSSGEPRSGDLLPLVRRHRFSRASSRKGRLDLGCGAGLVSAELGRRARVVALDRRRSSSLSHGRMHPQAPSSGPTWRTSRLSRLVRRGVVAFLTSIHVQRDRHASVLSVVHAWLRLGVCSPGHSARATAPRTFDEDFFGAPMSWSHFFDAATSLEARARRRVRHRAGRGGIR